MRRLAATLALGLAVAGCGSTTVRHVTRTITATQTTQGAGTGTTTRTSTITSTTPPTGSTTASASSAASGASPLAGRSPMAILQLARAALTRSGGYAMSANLRAGDTRQQISMTTSGGHTFNVATTDGRSVSEMVRTGQGAYLRGNLAFWRAQGGSTATARARSRGYANRWLALSAAGERSLTRSLGSLAPETLARCLVEDHGTLSIAGHATVGGVRAVIVRDAGNAPGATPSTIAVAASGTPYPLRYVATGRSRAGGRVDVCNNGKGGNAEGTIRLSQFGQIPPIQAPEGASGGSGVTA